MHRALLQRASSLCWPAPLSTLLCCTLPHAGLYADHHGGWPHHQRALCLQKFLDVPVPQPKHSCYLGSLFPPITMRLGVPGHSGQPPQQGYLESNNVGTVGCLDSTIVITTIPAQRPCPPTPHRPSRSVYSMGSATGGCSQGLCRKSGMLGISGTCCATTFLWGCSVGVGRQRKAMRAQGFDAMQMLWM